MASEYSKPRPCAGQALLSRAAPILNVRAPLIALRLLLGQLRLLIRGQRVPDLCLHARLVNGEIGLNFGNRQNGGTNRRLVRRHRIHGQAMCFLRLAQPLFDGAATPTYDELLAEFQFDSPQQASNALITAKRHFQRVLCDVVGEYVEHEQDIAHELADLHAIAGTAGTLGIDWQALGIGVESRGSGVADGNVASEIGLSELFLCEHRAHSWAWEAQNPHVS